VILGADYGDIHTCLHPEYICLIIISGVALYID
jgi:hypothetical protein